MARVESLSVLNKDDGKAFLAETYGKVIDNIAKDTISSKWKNTDLSGAAGGASLEATRFQNSESKTYGTARGAGKGDNVKVDTVTVAIDQHREIIHDVESFDVQLYGVDNFIARKSKGDELDMKRELERAFFSTAKTAGTKVTPTATAADEILEEFIQAVETVKNEYVDGVPRDLIRVAMSPSLYGKVRKYLDEVENDAATEKIRLFHGVEVESSTYLPEGVELIAMIKGAVAQPIMADTEDATGKYPASKAYYFGVFYDYGTKAVTPDLIFYHEPEQA